MPIGRVEMWRGGSRSGLSAAAPFVWRCQSNVTIAPFSHPADQTERADFPHPALFQNIKPSRSRGWPPASASISVPVFHRGTGRGIGGTRSPLSASAHQADPQTSRNVPVSRTAI
ncbi:hypothetical protein DF143_37205 [Burkholderia cenocepacia]|nr:hypothetical protein DF143_37205 [Burkholderia cenocepacia]RQV32011.1 hypothetical protein DF033_36765 [Burkholderia cenocepacia]